MRFDAGELRERITIQRATETPDGVGGQERTWAVLRTVRAKVTSHRARESVEAEALSGINSYKIIIRKTDVDWKDRLIWRGETLAVTGVTFINPERTLMQIDAERGVGT